MLFIIMDFISNVFNVGHLFEKFVVVKLANDTIRLLLPVCVLCQNGLLMYELYQIRNSQVAFLMEKVLEPYTIIKFSK